MLIYIGQGASVPGLPARDLSDDEVRIFGGETAILATGLYAHPPDLVSELPPTGKPRPTSNKLRRGVSEDKEEGED